MPWVVKECGRRGADGAGDETILVFGCVTGYLVRSSGYVRRPQHAISGLDSGLPEALWLRQLRIGPHPEERASRRASRRMATPGLSWFETAQERLLTMRDQPPHLVARRVVWLGFSARLRQGLMLFNSYQFLFLFLPVALAGYFVAGRFGNLAPVIWLALASLVFYSVSNWQFVALLLASIAFNYLIGLLLISKRLHIVPRLAV